MSGQEGKCRPRIRILLPTSRRSIAGMGYCGELPMFGLGRMYGLEFIDRFRIGAYRVEAHEHCRGRNFRAPLGSLSPR